MAVTRLLFCSYKKYTSKYTFTRVFAPPKLQIHQQELGKKLGGQPVSFILDKDLVGKYNADVNQCNNSKRGVPTLFWTEQFFTHS